MIYFVGIGVLFALLLYIWPKEGKLGVNLNQTACPICETKLPRIRKPENETQALFGGWTCPNCKTEVDKYGKLK